MLASKKTLLQIIGASALLMFLAAVSWFLYQKIIAVSTVQASSEGKIASLEEQAAEFSRSEENLKNLESEINLINNAFINEESFVEVVRFLEGLARASDLKFTAESAKLPTSQKEEANILFTVEGDFNSAMRFLILLDRSPYSGFISALAIGPRNTSTAGRKSSGPVAAGTIAAKINYTIFNFKAK